MPKSPLACLDDVNVLAASTPGARSKTMKALLEALGPGYEALGWTMPRAGGRTGPAGPPIARVRHTGAELTFNVIPGGTFTPGPSARHREALAALARDASPEAREHIEAVLDAPARAAVTVRPLLLGWVPLSGDEAQALLPELGDVQGAPAVFAREHAERLVAMGFSLPTAEEHEWAHRATLDTLYAWGDAVPTTATRFEAAAGAGPRPAATNAFALMGIGAWPEFVTSGEGTILGVRGGMAELFPFQGLGEELLGLTVAPLRAAAKGCARLALRIGAPAPKAATSTPARATEPAPPARYTSMKLALRAGPAACELVLREAKLSAIPPGIAKLSNLRSLDLCGARIESLPAELGELRALEVLDLSANEILKVDPAVAKLPRLRHLTVSTGEAALPAALDVLFRLPSLETLRMPSCHAMTSLPECLAGHPGLAELDLWLARALGRIPDVVRRIPRLRRLRLADMELAELPERFDGLEGLAEIDLSDNPLRALPPAFFELPLEVLRLRDVNHVVLDGNVARLTSLRVLNLGAVRTPLPKELGKLRGLRELSLSNGACDAAPPFLAELESLEELDVSCNDLVDLPAEVYALPRLRKIICFNSGLGDRIEELRAAHPGIVFED